MASLPRLGKAEAFRRLTHHRSRPLAMLSPVATLRSANSQLALWREFRPGDALRIPKSPSWLGHIPITV
jgi:hypothetical protein